MPRIKPDYVIYTPNDYVVTQEMRVSLEQRLSVHFTDQDYDEMAAALRSCVGIYKARRLSPDRNQVVTYLEAMSKAAASLGKQLQPLISEDLSATPIPAWEALYHLWARAERTKRDLESDLPSYFMQLTKNLSMLRDYAKDVAAEVAQMDTLKSGKDSAHLDAFMRDLLPILARRGISTTYVTPDGSASDRSAPAAYVALVLGQLLPEKLRPTQRETVASLVRVRRKIKARKASADK